MERSDEHTLTWIYEDADVRWVVLYLRQWVDLLVPLRLPEDLCEQMFLVRRVRFVERELDLNSTQYRSFHSSGTDAPCVYEESTIAV